MYSPQQNHSILYFKNVINYEVIFIANELSCQFTELRN